MLHTVLIAAFIIFEGIATFQAWVPDPPRKINFMALGLVCFAASLLT